MSVQIWTHCRTATMEPGAAAPYGQMEDAALVVDGERLAWVGPRAELPAAWRNRCTAEHDGGGALITPGLIDCHTHLVFGGDRAAEFEMRLKGATYQEIAAAGGGIVSTVRATRKASTAAGPSTSPRQP